MRATLQDRTVLRARVMLPAWGLPYAEVEIDGREPLDDGTVQLAINDMMLEGTVVTSGSWRGRRRYRIVGGSGGWGEAIEARGYTSDWQVLAATVLADAAAAAGEIIDVSGVGAESLGHHWTRPAGVAARVLEMVASQNWRVDLDGITRIGPPPETEFLAAAARVDLPDRAVDRIELAPVAAVSSLVPGVVVDDMPVVDVEHRVEDGTLRTSVWGAHGASSRIPSALARLVDVLTARSLYRGVFSYRVVSQDEERLDLQPERAVIGLPWLQRVRTRYAPGLKAEHTPGSLVLVAFVDGDPSRPAVISGDDPGSPAWLPETLVLDADGDVEAADGAYAVLLNGQSGLTISGVQAGGGVSGVQISVGPPPVPSPDGLSRLKA